MTILGDPVDRRPDLFTDYQRPRGNVPAWLTFERVTSTIAAVAGMLVLSFQLGGWSSLTGRDIQELDDELGALARRIEHLEVDHVRREDLALIRAEIERIRNRLER